MSDFADYFVAEILFLGSVRDNVFDRERLSQFRFSDICPKAQVGIKTRSKVEGLEIEHPYEAYEYGRVLLRSDIELLVINRLINKNPLEAGIPMCFVPIYNKLMQNAPEEAEERIEDCQDALARQMFAASEATAFWALLNEIVTLIDNNPHASVEEVFRKLNPETLSNCKFLDVLSAQYFIAIVKDGLK